MGHQRVADTFRFPPELGQRLKKLRQTAGLNQRELATRMGRKARLSAIYVSQIERGQRPFPSIALIADYLRACRAGFKDVLDILDAYTCKPTASAVSTGKALDKLVEHLPVPVQKGVLKYERRTARAMAKPEPAKPGAKPKKKRVLTETERFRRVVLLFAHAYQRRVLEDRLFGALKSLGRQVPGSKRKEACEYGRRVFGTMKQYRSDALKRRARLKKLERAALDKGVERAAVETMAKAGMDAFGQLAREGRVDWLPTPEEFDELEKGPFEVMRAEARMNMEQVGMLLEYGKARHLFKTLIALDVNREMAQQGLASELSTRIVPWLLNVLETAIEKGVEAARQQAEAHIPRFTPADVCRRAAEHALVLFEERKSRLPVRSA